MKKLLGGLMAVVLATGCTKPMASNVKELARNSGKLYLAKNAGPLRYGEVTYTIYESGRIDMHGDISFVVPGTNVEIDLPFNKSYQADSLNIQSLKYRNVVSIPMAVERMDMIVTSVDPEKQISRATAKLARTTHWTDDFYGAERLELAIDTSNDIIRLVSVKILGGYTFYNPQTKQTYPSERWDSFGHQIAPYKLDNGFAGIELVDQKPGK